MPFLWESTDSRGVCDHTSLWFQLLRWSATSTTAWALTGGASAASFMKWRPESVRSEPAESAPACRTWREESRGTRRNMEKSSAPRWNKSALWWVHEPRKSEVNEKKSCEENGLFFPLFNRSYWLKTQSTGWAARVQRAETYRRIIFSTKSISGCWRQDLWNLHLNLMWVPASLRGLLSEL